MFGDVWTWAGDYRTSNKNLSVEQGMIVPRLYEVFEQISYWVDHQTFQPDEIAIRFHHALVVVHPFPNGNGRWSRLMGDVLAVRLGRPAFSWSGGAHWQTPEHSGRDISKPFKPRMSTISHC